MHTNYQPLYRDGCGDDGARLRLVATELAKRGWSDGGIKQRVMADPACVHPSWDDLWVQQEIDACIRKVRPLEPKPVAAKKKVTQIWDDGLPGWLRARIESVAVPVDRDRHFYDVVAGLACRGWDTRRITVEIAGRPWIPTRYAASHALEYSVGLLLMVVPLSKIDDAEPDDVAALPPWLRSSSEAAPAVENVHSGQPERPTGNTAAAGLRKLQTLRMAPDAVAAPDVRAVQSAIAAGRWRESVQAKQWAGHAVAAAMKLDAEADKAKIVGLLKTWIESGALVVVEGEDEQRKTRRFVEVGSAAPE